MRGTEIDTQAIRRTYHRHTEVEPWGYNRSVPDPIGHVVLDTVNSLCDAVDDLRESLSLMSGHDRSGLNHLEEMMQASIERDEAETKNDRLLGALWDIRMEAERGSVNDPCFVLPNAIIHRALVAIGSDKTRAKNASVSHSQ